MSRPLCWSFSVVKLLELYSVYFGRYCRNWLSFTALRMYLWCLKMVYYKVNILLKIVSCKVMTIANKPEHFNCMQTVICIIERERERERERRERERRERERGLCPFVKCWKWLNGISTFSIFLDMRFDISTAWQERERER